MDDQDFRERILMTVFGSLETAIKAVKEGAFDYISKPFDIETMVATVQRALALRSPGRMYGIDNKREMKRSLPAWSAAIRRCWKSTK